ncbi:MAG TPA: hypothetical protein VJV78_10935 [Polyangiales bacterium]|nr:hypothetical protein [Polyangiales bacterium]
MARRSDQSEPAGPEACAAAGGRCVLGSSMNCAQRGPQDCNPTRNPGGAFCCLKDAAPKAGSPAPAVDAGTPAGRGGAGAAGSSGGGGGGGASGGDAADGGAAPTEQVDYSCETDADCTVENVGNCCGHFPRCVNKESPTPAFECPPGVGSVCGLARHRRLPLQTEDLPQHAGRERSLGFFD